MQKEFLDNLREMLVNQGIQEKEVRKIIKSTSNWVKTAQVETHDVQIQINSHKIEEIVDMLNNLIKHQKVLFCGNNTLISEDEIKLDKKSWFTTFDEKEKIFQLFFVSD